MLRMKYSHPQSPRPQPANGTTMVVPRPPYFFFFTPDSQIIAASTQAFHFSILSYKAVP